MTFWTIPSRGSLVNTSESLSHTYLVPSPKSPTDHPFSSAIPNLAETWAEAGAVSPNGMPNLYVVHVRSYDTPTGVPLLCYSALGTMVFSDEDGFDDFKDGQRESLKEWQQNIRLMKEYGLVDGELI